MLASRPQLVLSSRAPAVNRATMYNRPSVACQALDDPKKLAAQAFCDEFVRDSQVIGAGGDNESRIL
eukprot:1145993-Pelagomonas_calceolata.AAC.4